MALAGVDRARDIQVMMIPRLRLVLLTAAMLSLLILGTAVASERWGGLVPCALCLVERWPWRLAIGFGLIGVLLPQPLARGAMLLVLLSFLAGIGAGGTHVGVEAGWWPSPLPECAAPSFGGGSVSERLARMPDRPSKPCDAPTYLVPGLPVSMAMMNLLASLLLAGWMGEFLWTTRGGNK